jgi:hypothetical protein
MNLESLKFIPDTDEEVLVAAKPALPPPKRAVPKSD